MNPTTNKYTKKVKRQERIDEQRQKKENEKKTGGRKRERERERERDRDRETETERDRERQREAERQRQRQTDRVIHARRSLRYIKQQVLKSLLGLLENVR